VVVVAAEEEEAAGGVVGGYDVSGVETLSDVEEVVVGHELIPAAEEAEEEEVLDAGGIYGILAAEIVAPPLE
jgi:hypothetical protein